MRTGPPDRLGRALLVFGAVLAVLGVAAAAAAPVAIALRLAWALMWAAIVFLAYVRPVQRRRRRNL